MGSSYNAEPMRNSITYQKPTRKPVDVSKRSWDNQVRQERGGPFLKERQD